MRIVTQSLINVYIDEDKKLTARESEMNSEEIVSKIRIDTAWTEIRISTTRGGRTIVHVKPSDLAKISDAKNDDATAYIITDPII